MKASFIGLKQKLSWKSIPQIVDITDPSSDREEHFQDISSLDQTYIPDEEGKAKPPCQTAYGDFPLTIEKAVSSDKSLGSLIVFDAAQEQTDEPAMLNSSTEPDSDDKLTVHKPMLVHFIKQIIAAGFA